MSDKDLRQKIDAIYKTMMCGKSSIQFVVGDGNTYTPVAGATTYYNPNLKGRKLLVYRNGFGYMHEGVEYTINPLGGFQLLIVGDIMSVSEHFTIIPQ